MIKLIIFIVKSSIALLLAILFTSCHYKFDFDDGIDGNGNLKTEKRAVNENFTKISVNRGIDVEITQADSVAIEVEADENILEHVKIRVDNGTLIITSDENLGFTKKRTVRVKMPLIESLETTSGASIKSKNILLGETLKVKSSSGSEINLRAEFEQISCESTSGSDILIEGKALKLETASSSGSEINAIKLLANEVYAQSTSGSATQVRAIVKLDAKASSGSSIDYDGKPKSLHKEENSGGSVDEN